MKTFWVMLLDAWRAPRPAPRSEPLYRIETEFCVLHGVPQSALPSLKGSGLADAKVTLEEV
jgi:hypothetical protein